ncbi:MAG: hypothetical protein JXR64_03215 [Spirochaetales bacterium]|nr:hypothetical protein [Spirochaetales bacterium]
MKKIITEIKTDHIDFSWHDIVSQLSNSFRLTVEESNSLEKSKIAKLIGALPFLANCTNPERVALNHLSTYMVALKGSKSLSYHTSLDDSDVLSRLDEINTFKSGGKQENKYNPINAGVWDYKILVDSLISDIEEIECKIMDEYFSISDAVFSSWSYDANRFK